MSREKGKETRGLYEGASALNVGGRLGGRSARDWFSAVGLDFDGGDGFIGPRADR